MCSLHQRNHTSGCCCQLIGLLTLQRPATADRGSCSGSAGLAWWSQPMQRIQHCATKPVTNLFAWKSSNKTRLQPLVVLGDSWKNDKNPDKAKKDPGNP